MAPKTPSRTLGPVSAEFIAALQNSGRSIFSAGEAQKFYGKDRFATADFLSDLVKRGVLARIKAGIFMILQAGSENAQLKNWLIIARELAGRDPYFISHYSAMRVHGMTSHPVLYVYLTMPKRKQDQTLSGITYHFVYSKKEHFWGDIPCWATKQDQVQISDVERTILDGVARPDLCGGIPEVARGIWAVQKKTDYQKLKQYSKKFRTVAAIKRLGFILETLSLAPEWIPMFLEVTAGAKDYVTLDPQGPKMGKYHSRWRLRININPDEIKEGVWG